MSQNTTNTVHTDDTVTGHIVGTEDSDNARRAALLASIPEASTEDRPAILASAASLGDLYASEHLDEALAKVGESAEVWAFSAVIAAEMKADKTPNYAIARHFQPSLSESEAKHNTMVQRVGRLVKGGRLLALAGTSDTERVLAIRKAGNRATDALMSVYESALAKNRNASLDRVAATFATERAAITAANTEATESTPEAAASGTESAEGQATGTEATEATRQGPRSAAGIPNNASTEASAPTESADKGDTLDPARVSEMTDRRYSAYVVAILGNLGERKHLTSGQRRAILAAVERAYGVLVPEVTEASTEATE